MLKRLEVEKAFKNAAIEIEGKQFGISKEVVPLESCLEITRHYFSEEVDERDVEIARLKAQINVYEAVISKSEFEIIIKEPKEVNYDAIMQKKTLQESSRG